MKLLEASGPVGTATGASDMERHPEILPRIVFPLQLFELAARLLEIVTFGVVTGVIAFWLKAEIPFVIIDNLDRFMVLAAVSQAIMAQIVGCYEATALFSMRESVSKLFSGWLGSMLFLLYIGFMLDLVDKLSSQWAISLFGAGFFALVLARALVVLMARWLKRLGAFDRNSAIFGAGEQGIELARYIKAHNELTLKMVGFYDDQPPALAPAAALPLPMRGGLAELALAIRKGAIDHVIIALPWADNRRLAAIVEALAAMPVRVRLAPEAAGFAYAHRPVERLGELPVMMLRERPISGIHLVEKWLEDRLLAIALLLVAGPLMLIVAMLVKLDSRGPIFFRQAREGFNCRQFHILKFRTMYHDQEEPKAVVQATRNDPRVTRIGRFLRRSSIDEIPQLINVLMGHMSLVGPRPHAPSTRAGGKVFSDVVASYAARHNVKPGLTGWAQIYGWRGETDTEEKLLKRLEHDLYYIENWSLGLDIYILVRTIAILIRPRHAH